MINPPDRKSKLTSTSVVISPVHCKPSSRNNFQQADSEHNHGQVCFKVNKRIAALISKPMNCQIPSKISIELAGHRGAVNRATWGPGEHSHLLCTVSMDRSVKIWDTTSHVHNAMIRSIICHDKAVQDCSWSKFNKSLLTCSYDRTTQLIDIEKG